MQSLERISQKSKSILLPLLAAAGLMLLRGPLDAAAPPAPPAPSAPPSGSVVLNTAEVGRTPGAKAAPADSGIFSMALDGQFVWLGRKGGVRRYDTKTGDWKFFLAKGCLGYEARTIASAAGRTWALFGKDADLCILDPSTGAWHTPSDWKTREHVRGGKFIRPTGAGLLITGEGGPDTEGVSIVDPASEAWRKLLPTKPVTGLWADDKFIWAGVSEGILRIDRANEAYSYFLPTDYKCGAQTMAVAGSQGSVFFGTAPSTDTQLGIAMKVYKDGIAVLTRPGNQRYSFRWIYYKRSERKRLEDDVNRSLVTARDLQTKGGLCIWNGSSWDRMTAADGLPSNTVNALAADDSRVYAATPKGLVVIDIKTRKVIRSFPKITSALALSSDSAGLWVATPQQVFRIPK